MNILILILGALLLHFGQPFDIEVRDIQAHLFCDETGHLSADVLGPEPSTLFNTPGGDGAPCAATSLLIVGEVFGADEDYMDFIRVGISAVIEANPAYEIPESEVERSRAIPIRLEGGSAYLSLMLYEIGCSPIRITMRVGSLDFGSVAVPKEPPEFVALDEREETIPFTCGH